MSINKYEIQAKWWIDSLQDRFGDERSIHSLADWEVIALIRIFGKAEITKIGNVDILYFHTNWHD